MHFTAASGSQKSPVELDGQDTLGTSQAQAQRDGQSGFDNRTSDRRPNEVIQDGDVILADLKLTGRAVGSLPAKLTEKQSEAHALGELVE